MFQCSLDTGDIPEDWRKAIIVPIHKKGNDPSSPASYRPISLTSVISKIFEKIIKVYLMTYLLGNGLLSKEQHGFLQSKSTTTNLLECLNDWTRIIDSGNPVDILYLDAAKAFDSVSHAKQIFKMRKAGTGGNVIKWFKNFLLYRKQCVLVTD